MMMSRILTSLTAGVVLVSMFPLDSLAEGFPFPTKAYIATYESLTDSGKSMIKVLSDGQGTAKTTATMGGESYSTIFKYQSKSIYDIMDSMKTVYKREMKKLPDLTANIDTIESFGMKKIGAKVIDGRACHGWEERKGDATNTIWLSDETGYMAQMETSSKAPPVALKLTLSTWKEEQPAASEFLVPSSYKMLDSTK